MVHALTMQYFEKIYKKLPGHGKGAGRKLRDIGKAYGEKKVKNESCVSHI